MTPSRWLDEASQDGSTAWHLHCKYNSLAYKYFLWKLRFKFDSFVWKFRFTRVLTFYTSWWYTNRLTTLNSQAADPTQQEKQHAPTSTNQTSYNTRLPTETWHHQNQVWEQGQGWKKQKPNTPQQQNRAKTEQLKNE